MVLDDIAKSTGFLDKVQPSASNILYNEDGHIYAFPYAGNELVVLYYNKAIFEEYGVEVPETMDDLMAAVKVFNENDIIPLSLFGKEKWITTALYDVFATRYIPEGIWGLDTGKTSLEDEAYTMGAAKLREFVDAGLLPDGVANLNYDQAASLFYEGKAAMFLNGQWEIQGSTDKLGDDVDWMYYPVAEGYEQNKFAMSGGGAAGGYAVNPNGEHAELAAEVAAYISEMYCEAKYLYRANPILALQVADGLEPDEAFPPMMQKLAVEIPNMTSTTKFAWGLQEPTFKVSIEDQSQFLITPDYTVEEFTAEVKKVLDRVER
jgi:raffinose/stachyose/melibiose transport system substrate-binding protein